MPNIYIKIEKEDIKTSKMGLNILVECKDNINLIFTPEALDELINDLKTVMPNKEFN